MQDVVTKGTGGAVNFAGMTIAGKTGTTSDDKDVWFVGYTPYYTAGVWAGYDIPTTKLKGTGEKNYHKKLWKSVMSRIHEDLENKAFEKPEDIIQVAKAKLLTNNRENKVVVKLRNVKLLLS